MQRVSSNNFMYLNILRDKKIQKQCEKLNI